MKLDRRMKALSAAHGIPANALENIRITSGRDAPLVLASGDSKGIIVNQPAIDQAIEHIREHDIQVFIADPFVRTHAVQENDNVQIDKVVWCFQQIIDKTNCAVGIVHHTRKPTGKGAASMHDARGASALVNAARVSHTLSTMTEKEAKDIGISEAERPWYIRLDTVKANLNPPAEHADWFKKINVALPSGDEVGTLERVELKRKVETRSDVDIICESLDDQMNVGDERPIHELRQQLFDKGAYRTNTDKNGWIRKCHKEMQHGIEWGDKIFKTTYHEKRKPRYLIECTENQVKDESDFFE